MEKKEEQSECTAPLGVLLDSVVDGLEFYILQTMNERGIPASLMDFALTSVTAKIKEMKYREYARLVLQAKGEERDG